MLSTEIQLGLYLIGFLFIILLRQFFMSVVVLTILEWISILPESSHLAAKAAPRWSVWFELTHPYTSSKDGRNEFGHRVE